ncbi:hypothetical protein CWI38_0480p0010 [Hamiltosporidium tvaerminnensis]|uniref:Uncharacterized protein n=1 Tax=Hamiltosporidium tvaerminnensis TaxID=1176355 RepID=A0A4Q9LY96_9MICR|nr:hypothetical protein CWI37_1086p0030 [Hamiltosporidium tvaerminnensis]TBU13277.1 hypothetical protein CWI38_0480p0010 [Hamiltosporidium tvaerminnensis]
MLHLFVTIIFNGCGIFTSDTPSTTIEEKSHNERGNGKESLVEAETGYTTESILYSNVESSEMKDGKPEKLIGNKTQAQPSSNTTTHKSILIGTIDGTNAANPQKSSKKVRFKDEKLVSIRKDESPTDNNKGSLSAKKNDTMPLTPKSPNPQQKSKPKFNSENEYDKFNQDLKNHMNNFLNRN